MGRSWIGIGLLVLFLVLGLWISFAMGGIHQEISQKLDQAAQQGLSGDLEEGIDLARQAYSDWEKHWHSTASVADHAPMDEIDGLFAQLEIYGKAGQRVEFAGFCSRLARLVAAVGEAHGLSWWNLL